MKTPTLFMEFKPRYSIDDTEDINRQEWFCICVTDISIENLDTIDTSSLSY